MAIELERVIPILRILDIAKAKAFYVDYLVRMQGVAELHAELKAKNYDSLRPGLDPDGPGGGPTLNRLDPFGNILRLAEHRPE